MSKYNKNIQQAIDQVASIYENEVEDVYTYHSFLHSLDVMQGVKLIGDYLKMKPEWIELLMIAGIFHDVGHREGFQDHEALSARIAEEFMLNAHYSQTDISLVKEAILSTRYPQKPKHLIAEVLCDADLMYFGSENFMDQAELLRTEWKLTGQSSMSKFKFYQVSQDFMSQHHYHTRYGRQLLEPEKNKNIDRLKKMIQEYDHD